MKLGNIKLGSLALIAILLVGAVAPAMAAPTIDASDTDATDTTSDIDDNSVVTLDGDNTRRVETIVQDGSAPDVVITRTDTSEEIYNGTVATSLGSGHYEVVIDDADLDNVDNISAGGNVSLSMTVTNSTGSTVTKNTNITLEKTRPVTFIESENATGVELVTGSSIPGVWDSIGEMSIPGLDYFDVDSASVEESDVNLSTGDERAVRIESTDLADRYSAASAEEDYESGDWMTTERTVLTTSDDEEHHVKVYYKEAPDSVDTESTTYETYDPDTDIRVLHVGSDMDGETVDVLHVANQPYGAYSAGQAFGWSEATSVYGL